MHPLVVFRKLERLWTPNRESLEWAEFQKQNAKHEIYHHKAIQI